MSHASVSNKSPVITPGALSSSAASLAASPAHGAGFAQVLDAHRSASAPAQPEKPKDSAPAKHEAAANGNATRTSDDARARQLRANRAQARPQGGDAAPAREARAPAAADGADARAAKKADTEDAPVDPSLADWLASLNWPQAQPVAPDTPPADAEADSAATQPAGTGVAPSDLVATAEGAAHRGARQAGHAGHATGDAAVAEDAGPAMEGTARRQRQDADDLQLQATDARAEARMALESPAAWQAAFEQAVAAPEGRPTAADAPVDSKVDLAAAAHALSGASALAERPGAEMAPTPSVHVPTPVDAPEFSQVLGAQLSVFAVEGIQQAELHLNPADMGPISVQISVDGDKAKVDFGADSAATRQVLENSLPELAAALRDAGFTLSGGGVHSQAQQQASSGRDGSGGNAPSRQQADAGGVAADASAGRPVQRTVRAGGVDLYA